MDIWTVIVAAVSGGGGAYLGAYLKEKGKNLATQEDFNKLRVQLEANTRVAEEIKSEFGQRDWAARQWATTRQLKLEELLKLCLSSKDRLEEMDSNWHDHTANLDIPAVAQAEALGALYFPEMKASVAALGSAIQDARISLVKYHYRSLKLGEVNVQTMRDAEIQELMNQKRALVDERRVTWPLLYERILVGYNVVTGEAAELMREIAGVSDDG